MQGKKANLTKNQLEDLYFNENLSGRKIATKLNLSAHTVERYMKKYEIKRRKNICGWLKASAQRKIICPSGFKHCYRCKQQLSLSQFPNSTSKRGHYCMTCNREYERERSNALKKQGIEYLGNSCKHCGFSHHIAALDFHHRIPSEKELNWNKLRKRSWKKIKLELDKCDLLCSNCHRIHHATERGYSI